MSSRPIQFYMPMTRPNGKQELMPIPQHVTQEPFRVVNDEEGIKFYRWSDGPLPDSVGEDSTESLKRKPNKLVKARRTRDSQVEDNGNARDSRQRVYDDDDAYVIQRLQDCKLSSPNERPRRASEHDSRTRRRAHSTEDLRHNPRRHQDQERVAYTKDHGYSSRHHQSHREEGYRYSEKRASSRDARPHQNVYKKDPRDVLHRRATHDGRQHKGSADKEHHHHSRGGDDGRVDEHAKDAHDKHDHRRERHHDSGNRKSDALRLDRDGTHGNKDRTEHVRRSSSHHRARDDTKNYRRDSSHHSTRDTRRHVEGNDVSRDGHGRGEGPSYSDRRQNPSGHRDRRASDHKEGSSHKSSRRDRDHPDAWLLVDAPSDYVPPNKLQMTPSGEWETTWECANQSHVWRC